MTNVTRWCLNKRFYIPRCFLLLKNEIVHEAHKATNWNTPLDGQRLNRRWTPCFPKLGFSTDSLFNLAGLGFQICLAFFWSFFCSSIPQLLESWRWLTHWNHSNPKPAPSLWTRQLNNYNCFPCCCLCYLSLAPLITVVDPTFIIVCTFKLQLACNYGMGSAFPTCSREQWETTSSVETLYTNISVWDQTEIFGDNFSFNFHLTLSASHHFPSEKKDTNYQQQLISN